MKIASETRNLARTLLAYETKAAISPEAQETATLRVYEKLRERLCVLAGAAGFQSLASRALTLTGSQVPNLSAVQVVADGQLRGISETNEIQMDEGVILISTLLELLLMFLGEALTMNLVRNVWPDAAFDKGNPRDGRKA